MSLLEDKNSSKDESSCRAKDTELFAWDLQVKGEEVDV